MRVRCLWAGSDPLMQEYHDKEWGVPLHEDRKLFEFLCLEGAQAGLSWLTILRKRENYRKAFDRFDPFKVAKYDGPRIRELLSNAGIVRHQLKIESAVTNARAFLVVQKEFGSFDRYLWAFVDGQPVQNRWKTPGEVPSRTPLSDSISKDLKGRGFCFVGSTICYAFLQAVGIVNDHAISCFRFKPLSRAQP